MNDRDRFERGRGRRDYDVRDDEHDFDRHRDGYSRLGGAGEEERERYRGREHQARDYNEDRGFGYLGSRGQYGGGAYGGERQRYIERDWGTRPRTSHRGPKGYKRSDERIREDVCDGLMMRPDIDSSEIEVRVSDGEVTLSGTVNDREEKYLVERLADSIPGVYDVHNTIRVSRGQNDERGMREARPTSSEPQKSQPSTGTPRSSNSS